MNKVMDSGKCEEGKSDVVVIGGDRLVQLLWIMVREVFSEKGRELRPD